MGLIAVASAKGSPGVTTTALLLGALWPRPVVVAECDPAGGDVALRMPAADGGVLDAERGLLSMAAAGRKAFYPEIVGEHTQTLLGGLDVLAGVRIPEQATGMKNQWPQLGPLFADLEGTDVIADLGRIGATTPQNALLEAASDVVLVVGVEPSAVVHLRERLRAVSGRVGGPTATRLHVVVISPVKRAQPVREIREAIERGEAEVASVDHLAHDPRGALFFAGQVRGRADRTDLVRTARPIVADLAEGSAAFFRPPAVEPEPVEAEPAVAGSFTDVEPAGERR